METKTVGLEAGAELDSLIAEKVMGWVRRGPYLVPPELNGRTLDHHQIPDVPAYSTDMGAAWQVVEKMGLWVGRERVTGKWEAVWDHGFVDVTADTAPLAVCRAALKAIRGAAIKATRAS